MRFHTVGTLTLTLSSNSGGKSNCTKSLIRKNKNLNRQSTTGPPEEKSKERKTEVLSLRVFTVPED